VTSDRDSFALIDDTTSVLRVLNGGPLSLSRLAEAAVRTTGGMTKIVDRLERRKLVQRTPDPTDRRGVLVALTDDGREFSAKASDAYGVGRDRILKHLTKEERETIERVLDRLVAAFEKDRES
jgi:DNA-binding MarR family transcriptional regulator